MQKLLLAIVLICFLGSNSMAQLRIQKQSLPVKKATPVMVNNTLQVNSAGNSAPTKVINIGGGKSILVSLRTNPNTGSEPAFNKINKQTLPQEQAAGSTCTVSKVVFTAESTTFMNGNNSNQIKLYPGAIYTFDDFFGGGYNEIITNRTFDFFSNRIQK